MKRFNLEEAKAGKPVCTRSGKPARIVCFDTKSTRRYPILALIDLGHIEYPLTYDNNGYEYSTQISDDDLMMVDEIESIESHNSEQANENDIIVANKPKKKRKGWINVNYFTHNDDAIAQPIVWKSKEQAEKRGMWCIMDNLDKVTTIEIEWEEE